MEIIRWKNWGDRENCVSSEDWDKYEEVLIEHIRENNYHFDGYYHQNGEFGVPVFEDEKSLYYSLRSWGEVMHKAWPDETSSYLDYYMDSPKRIYPANTKIITDWKDNEKCANYNKELKLCEYNLGHGDGKVFSVMRHKCSRKRCPISNPKLLNT